MIQLICNGVEVDVPRGTSIAWKNTNILFAFDKASCERSLTFTLPSTATNDTVFELCRLPQYVGQGFRRLYDAEYRDGLLVKRGYAYVTQSQKSGYNVTLVVGELTALKRLKDAGKVGEVLPDAAITVPKAAVDARQAEYSGMKVLKTVHTDLTQNIMPSWCFRPLLVDVLNELQVPFALPSVAEELRIMIKGLNGAKTSVKFKNVRHSDVTGPYAGAEAYDKYNTLTVSDDTIVEVFQNMQLHAYSYGNGVLFNSPQWEYDHRGVYTPMPIRANTLLFGVVENSYDIEEWSYNSDAYHTLRECTLTFPSDFPDDAIVKILHYDGGTGCDFFKFHSAPVDGSGYPQYYIYHTEDDEAYPTGYSWIKDCAAETTVSRSFDASTGIADTTWDDATDTPNTSLAGITITLPADTYFIITKREDYACAYDANDREFIYDYQPRFNDYEYDIEVEADIIDTPTDWTFSKRQNSPDMTAVDMLKTLANVSGKVLYYTDANGITFEDLLTSDFTPLDLTSKLISIKNLKPRFSDYDKANIVKYKDDDMTTQQDMISIDYESNAAMLKGEKTLQTLPFSCVSNSRVFVGSETGEYFDRARIVDGNNKKPSADVLLTINANDTYTQRVPLIKNPTIQQLCKEPLTIEATLHMSNYEYSKIQPFSLIHINGVDYVWTESSWQKGTATLTLSKLPLTLSQPRPTPPPAPYTYYDYIEANGQTGQYIDTGVIVGGDCSIEIDYMWMSKGGGNSSIWICGERDSPSLYYYMRSLDGYMQVRYYNNSHNSPYIKFQKAYAYQRHKNVIAIYDGDNVFYTVTPTLRAISPTYTHYLFSMNSRGTPSKSYEFTDTRIGTVRIYDSNDVLVRDFRPAVRNADGVAGMHDVVNDVFYPSANGVNFLYGNF